MAWRVLITQAAEQYLDAFSDLDELTAALMRWVEKGPPGTTRRRVQGIPFYEDTTPEGIKVQYFVGTEPDLYVAIVRLIPPPRHVP